MAKKKTKDTDIQQAEMPKGEVADTQLTNLSQTELMNELYKRGYTPEDILNKDKLTGPEIEALATLNEKSKGGIPKQMEMFEDGGLKDEGGEVDEESGNEVPPGSTKEEVRDDIPARLSEGEFVFPADVVRYLGLDFLMKLRQRAKAGLQKMEDMGQMGNSDEATLPDDIPFTIDDLDMEDDPLEMQVGGVVTNPMGNPTAMPNQVTTMNNPNVYNPNIGQIYTPGGVTPYAPATFKSLLPQSSTGQVKTINKRYVNKETGQVRMIPHVEGTNKPLYPVPEGFVLEETPTEEKKPKAKVETAKVKKVTEQDGGDPNTDPTSASLSFGGKKDPNNPGLQQNAITANISYNVGALGTFGLFSGLGKVADINKGKDVQTKGNQFGLTTNPVEMSYGKGKSISLTSKQYAEVKNNVYGKTAKDLKSRLEVLDNIASREYSFDPDKNQYTDNLGNTLSYDEAQQAGKDIQDHIQSEVSKGKDIQDVIGSLNNSEVSMAQDAAIEAEDDQGPGVGDDKGMGIGSKGVSSAAGAPSLGIGADMGDLSDDNNDSDNGGGGGGGGGKIICTTMNKMYGLPMYSNKVWMRYNKYKNLDSAWELGYHKIFLSLVKRMPTNKYIRIILEWLAKNRTHGVKEEMRGNIFTTNTLLIRPILGPIVYLTGKLVQKGYLKKVDVKNI